MSNFSSISVAPQLAAIAAQIVTVDEVVDGNAVIIEDIHDTDLPGVNTIVTQTGLVVIDIHDTDLPAVEEIAAANEVILTDIHDTDLPAAQTDLDILTQEAEQRNVGKIYQGNINNATFADVVNITDKGVLTGISQQCTAYTADGRGYIKLVIDGTQVVSDPFLNFYEAGDHRALRFQHRFNTSLQVQHKINAADLGTVHTFVACTIDA